MNTDTQEEQSDGLEDWGRDSRQGRERRPYGSGVSLSSPAKLREEGDKVDQSHERRGGASASSSSSSSFAISSKGELEHLQKTPPKRGTDIGLRALGGDTDVRQYPHPRPVGQGENMRPYCKRSQRGAPEGVIPFRNVQKRHGKTRKRGLPPSHSQGGRPKGSKGNRGQRDGVRTEGKGHNAGEGLARKCDRVDLLGEEGVT